MEQKQERLSKILAQKGIASRRESDEMISKGWVLLADGQPASLGLKIAADAEWSLTREAKDWLLRKKTLMLHKPVGYVSGQPEKNYLPAIRLIQKSSHYPAHYKKKLELEGMAPVGRLDIDSRGLLLFTQNGCLAKAIIGPEANLEKEYQVKVNLEMSHEQIKKLRHGLSLDDQALKPAKIKTITPTWWGP